MRLYGDGFFAAFAQCCAVYYIGAFLLHWVLPRVFPRPSVRKGTPRPGQVEKEALNSVGAWGSPPAHCVRVESLRRSWETPTEIERVALQGLWRSKLGFSRRWRGCTRRGTPSSTPGPFRRLQMCAWQGLLFAAMLLAWAALALYFACICVLGRGGVVGVVWRLGDRPGYRRQTQQQRRRQRFRGQAAPAA